jgi:hypothetical protein
MSITTLQSLNLVLKMQLWWKIQRMSPLKLWKPKIKMLDLSWSIVLVRYNILLYPRSPKGEGVYCFTSVRPSVCPRYFRRIFLSNCRWQKSDIWSQASYRYPISWEAFLDPSDSYFLFVDFVDFYTHWTYMHIFRHIFLSNY